MAFTKRRKRTRGGWGKPWTALSWPYGKNATYLPLNNYNAQIDRTLRVHRGGRHK